MSGLVAGVEIAAGLAAIGGGVLVTWMARGGKPTSISLSLVPVSALALMVVGAAVILNGLGIL